MKVLNEVVISIGSNHGDRVVQVADGIEWIKCILKEVSSSEIYSTIDCHGGKRDYMNAVVKGVTAENISSLDALCKQYEFRHGRTEEARGKGYVPVDIDVVIFNHDIIRPKDFNQDFFQIGYKQIYSNQPIKSL